MPEEDRASYTSVNSLYNKVVTLEPRATVDGQFSFRDSCAAVLLVGVEDADIILSEKFVEAFY